MSTFNAGAIEANLALDRSSWARDLERVKQEIQDLEDTSISIMVDADTTNADIVLDNFERNLDALENDPVKVTVDVENESEDDLSALRANLEALENNTVTIPIDVDTTAAEEHMIGFLTTMQALTLNRPTIGVDVDSAKAEAQLAILEAMAIGLDSETIDLNVDADNLNATVSEANGHMGLLRILIYAIIALSPILVVAIVAAGAAIIGFVAALTAAIGPAILLGIVLAKLIKQFKDTKPGDMTPGMLVLADALKEIKKAWNDLLDSVGDDAFRMMGQAVGVMADILPLLEPMLKRTIDMVGGLVESFGKFTQGPEFKSWIRFFSGFGVNMLETFLRIGGNLISFFMNLFQAFRPFAKEMMGGLEDVTAGWADWASKLGKNNGFQAFIDTALEYGPSLLHMIGSLWDALVNIGKALEPFAGPMIALLTGVFDIISSIPTPILTAAIGLFVALFTIFKIILPIVSALMTAWEVFAAVLGVISGPVLLIIGAIALLAAGVYFLVKWFKSGHEAGQGFTDGMLSMSETVMPIVNAIVDWFREHWPEIKQIIDDTIQGVLAVIGGFLQLLAAAIQIGIWIWHHFGDEIKTYLHGVWQIISGIIRGAVNIILGIFHVMHGLLTGNWREMWNGVKQILHGAVQALGGIIKGLFNMAKGIFGALGKVLGALWRAVWNAVTDYLKDKINDIKGLWDGIVNFFRKAPGRIASATAGMWDGIKTAFRSAINSVIGWWNNLHFTIPAISIKGHNVTPSVTVNTPDIGYLAKGAYVEDPMLAMIGEGDEPEIVTPESKMREIVAKYSGRDVDYDRMAEAFATALARVLTGGGFGASRADIEALLASGGANIKIDATQDVQTLAHHIVARLSFELRRLGFGGKANV